MMRGVIVGVIAVIVAGLICAYGLLQGGFMPANADAKPGGLELWAANTSLSATLRRESPKGANPVTLTDEHLTEGVKLFGDHCAICHGAADGTASPVARGLYPALPQLATDGVEDDAEGVSYWKIKHGIRLTGMPSWAGTLNDTQIWTLALFLKHMDKLPPGPLRAWKQVKN